jgi:hypothetical protein
MSENYQDVLARCFVAIAEMDHDLREWAKDIKKGDDASSSTTTTAS